MNQYLQEQAILYVSKLKGSQGDQQESDKSHVCVRERRLTLAALIARLFGQQRRTRRNNPNGRALRER